MRAAPAPASTPAIRSSASARRAVRSRSLDSNRSGTARLAGSTRSASRRSREFLSARAAAGPRPAKCAAIESKLVSSLVSIPKSSNNQHLQLASAVHQARPGATERRRGASMQDLRLGGQGLNHPAPRPSDVSPHGRPAPDSSSAATCCARILPAPPRGPSFSRSAGSCGPAYFFARKKSLHIAPFFVERYA